MGILFTLALEADDQREIRCHCGGKGPLISSYAEFRAFMDEWRAAPYQLPGCEDDFCLDYAPAEHYYVQGEEPQYATLDSHNQASVLEALGFSAEDDCGTVAAEDMEGRVLMALAVAPVSPQIPRYEVRGDRGALQVYGEREEGYVQAKLLALQLVVEQAKRLDRAISWA